MTNADTANLNTPQVSDADIVARGWDAVANGDWDRLVTDYTKDMVFVMPGQDVDPSDRRNWRSCLGRQLEKR
jgi:ketosteroid isomerase-like protein